MTTNIASPTPPDFQSRLDIFKMEIFNQLNCHEVGQIVSFDVGTGKASVQIQVLRLVNGTPTAYPLLTDCPVFVNSGGGACLTMPIAAGDPCLVAFNDRDLDIWFTSGNVSVPNSIRAHSLSDGLVFVSFRNLANKIASWSTTDAQLRNGSVVIGATPTKIDLHNASGGLKTAMDLLFTALTSWVNTGGTTPNPATVTAITAAKTAVDALLL